MNTAPPDLVPDVTPTPEVLIREARRRQRRRYLVVSAAIAAVTATAVALIGGSGVVGVRGLLVLSRRPATTPWRQQPPAAQGW